MQQQGRQYTCNRMGGGTAAAATAAVAATTAAAAAASAAASPPPPLTNVIHRSGVETRRSGFGNSNECYK